MKPFQARLCDALVKLGYRDDFGTVTLQCEAETLPLLLTWPDGECRKVAWVNLQSWPDDLEWSKPV